MQKVLRALVVSFTMALIFSLGNVNVWDDSLSQLELLGFSCFSGQEIKLASLVNKNSAQTDAT